VNKIILLTSLGLLTGLIGCSPVKVPVTNEYKLENYSAKKLAPHFSPKSILISQPEAVTGYQTEQMLYMAKPYKLSAFAHNAWIGSPADMLYPLILQSVQRSGYFYAVASSANAGETDYRIDTQVLAFHQSFLKKPSELRLTCKIVLTNVSNNHIVASKIIEKRIPCREDTPLGGVEAANKAAVLLTEEIAQFLVRHVKADRG
jgi:cholesterol transport system auxiliary component